MNRRRKLRRNRGLTDYKKWDGTASARKRFAEEVLGVCHARNRLETEQLQGLSHHYSRYTGLGWKRLAWLERNDSKQFEQIMGEVFT
jgi:hypothetical protein